MSPRSRTPCFIGNRGVGISRNALLIKNAYPSPSNVTYTNPKTKMAEIRHKKTTDQETVCFVFGNNGINRLLTIGNPRSAISRAGDFGFGAVSNLFQAKEQ